MLSIIEVAAMRAIQGEALPDSCVRTRVPLVADGAGGHMNGTPVMTPYPCRVAPAGGRELEIAARITSAVAMTVTLPWNADIISGDTLTIGGRILKVITPLVGGTTMTALRVLAVES
jgi:hypothetical protein